jgi:serine/threonine-protein kinase
MVEVPAGSALLGSGPADREALPREKPQRQVTLAAFWIDRYEVTNSRYAQCVQAGKCAPAHRRGVDRPGYYADTDAPLQPVVGVTFKDASDYCAWVGRRLPTEAEWEKAARGTDGRIYPWGGQPPTCELANFNQCDKVALPVGSRPAGRSPYGAEDMAGNVIEWTTTPYKGNYYAKLRDRDPVDPPGGGWRTLRGGSWGSYPNQVRTAFRRAWDPTFAGHTIGFRCASSSAPPTAPAR